MDLLHELDEPEVPLSAFSSTADYNFVAATVLASSLMTIASLCSPFLAFPIAVATNLFFTVLAVGAFYDEDILSFGNYCEHYVTFVIPPVFYGLVMIVIFTTNIRDKRSPGLRAWRGLGRSRGKEGSRTRSAVATLLLLGGVGLVGAAEPVAVTTAAELIAAISNDVTIELAADITLTATGCSGACYTQAAISVTSVTGLVINGNGYTIGFGSSSSGNGRAFAIESSSDVTMNDLTIQNSYLYSTSQHVFGGAISSRNSVLTMNSCILSNNKVHAASGNWGSARGGAISCSQSTCTLNACTLSENSVQGSASSYSTINGGGAIESSSSVVTLTGCILSSNTAMGNNGGRGGAIQVRNNDDEDGTVTCVGCYFSSNSAQTSSNDVYAVSGSFQASACATGVVSGGSGSIPGQLDTNTGTHYSYACPQTWEVSAQPDLYNKISHGGTAVMANGDTVTVSSGNFEAGSAHASYVIFSLYGLYGNIMCVDDELSCVLHGSGTRRIMYIGGTSGSLLELRSLVFTNGYTDTGGGLYTGTNARVSLVMCSFQQNEGTIGAGGIYASYGDVVDLYGVSFSGNTSPIEPAIYNSGDIGNWNGATITIHSSCSAGEN